MTLEFLFAPKGDTEATALRQGDLLVRNDRLKASIAQAHAYYADADSYSHFLVLTQSCDLVRRGGKPPRSRYITIAAARPLSLVVDRFLEKHKFPEFEFPIMLCNKERELLAKQLLERLLHNTEEGFFFLRKGSHPLIAEDLCVFLSLSIALRIEHYDSCLSAKIAQLDHVFAAKVGSLVGNMYARVGTPDIEEHVVDPDRFKSEFFEEALYDRTAWLSGPQFRTLKRAVNEWRVANAGRQMTPADARGLIAALPSDLDLVIDRAVEALQISEVLPRTPEVTLAARNAIANDVNFQRLLKGSQNKT